MFGEAAKASARRRPVPDDAGAEAHTVSGSSPSDSAPARRPPSAAAGSDALSEHGDTVGERNHEASWKGSAATSLAVKKLQRRVREQDKSFRFVSNVLQECDQASSMVLRRERLHEKASAGDIKTHVLPQDKMPFLIFHPYTAWRLGWDMAMTLIIMYTFLAVPVRLAFPSDASECNRSLSDQDSMWYVDVMIDLIFLCDVGINFRTAYSKPVRRKREVANQDQVLEEGPAEREQKEEMITDWKKIAWRYFTGFFFIDLAAAIPMDLILLSLPCSVPSSNGEASNTFLGSVNNLMRGPTILKILRLAVWSRNGNELKVQSLRRRVVRLLKVDRLKQIMQIVRDRLQLHPGRIRLFKFSLFIFLMMHWNACIFAMIANISVQAAQGSWLDIEDETKLCDSGVSFATEFTVQTNSIDDGSQSETVRARCFQEMKWTHKWTVSMYWALTTMTTIGYGDLVPYNIWETGFVIVALCEAGFAFSFFIGNIAVLLKRTDLRKMKYQESLEVWENFIHRENVSKSLADRIRSYLSEIHKNPVVDLPAFAREQLPRTLLKDITGHLYTSVLQKFGIFRHVDNGGLMELALSLQPMQLAPHATIFKEDEPGQCMYFLAKGTIELSMILLSSANKQKLGLQVVQDVTSEHLDNNADAIQYECVTKNESNLTTRTPYTPLVFRWYRDETSDITYFGENVLNSATGQRLCSAMARKWSLVYRLDREALRMSAKKSDVMLKVYKRLRAKKQTRLMRAVRMTLDSLRTRYTNLPRLLVKVERAERLPNTDGILGKCDPFVTVRLGDPGPSGKWKQYQTLVKYNQLDPEWNETFMFPIDNQLVQDVLKDRNESNKTNGRYPSLHFEVFDYDHFGDNDLVGRCELDLRDFFYNVFSPSERSDNTRHFETHLLNLLKTNKGGVSVAVHNGKRGVPPTALKLTVQLVVPDGAVKTHPGTAEKAEPLPVDSSSALTDVESLSSPPFPPPCPPSNPPSPDPTPRIAPVLDENDKILPVPGQIDGKLALYGMGTSSTAISRKALNPPPAYDAESLLNDLERVAPSGGLILANTTPSKHYPIRHQDSDISGYSMSDSDDAGDHDTYQRNASFESDMSFQGSRTVDSPARALPTRVQSQPILGDDEQFDEFTLLLAHISEETGQALQLQQPPVQAKSRGPMVEMEQDDNKGPSAPSGPKGGTTSRRSSANSRSSSSQSEIRPAKTAESGSLIENAEFFLPDSSDEARKAITLLLRTIDTMKREREADMAEQRAKMHAIEEDMDLVSSVFAQQALQIETLKMENKTLLAQAASARSAPGQGASNANAPRTMGSVLANANSTRMTPRNSDVDAALYNSWMIELDMDVGVAERLVEHAVDLNTLLELDAADFERLGIQKVGWQKKLVRKARDALFRPPP